MNWYGTLTLYQKEVWRFLKVYNQTLIAPLITSLLFLAVFDLALSNHVKMINDVPFSQFMASGLIIMVIVQNAFANTSSTLVMGKVMGTIVDYLMPPFSPGALMIALVGGGITRGILVGILTSLCLAVLIPLQIHHWGYVIFYSIAASTLLSLLGVFTGIIAETFDQMSAVTSYIITPLSFLSGTFYSIKDLPPLLYLLCHFNPFFYMIDGFRFGMTGSHDGSITIGIMVLLSSIICLTIAIYWMLKRGYRTKT